VKLHSDCDVVFESLSQLVPLQTSRFRDFAHPLQSSFKKSLPHSRILGSS
jgi:hypothetical protein